MIVKSTPQAWIFLSLDSHLLSCVIILLQLTTLLVCVTSTSGTYQEQAKIVLDNLVSGSFFGFFPFDVLQNTIVAGAPYDDTGYAYIYAGSGSNWTFQAKLAASDARKDDTFGGCSVFLPDNPNKVLIGCPLCVGAANSSGAVYEFSRPDPGSTDWTQTAKFYALGGQTDDAFGHSIAVDQDTAIIAAPGLNQTQGGAYAFVKDETGVWSYQDILLPPDVVPYLNVGYQTALEGETAVLGSGKETANGRNVLPGGAVYIYTRVGISWTFSGKVAPKYPLVNYFYGSSLALLGNTLAVGSWGRCPGPLWLYGCTGAVHVFQPDSTGKWSLTAELRKPRLVSLLGTTFSTVALTDNLLFVGAPSDQGKNRVRNFGRGAVYVYQTLDDGATWTEKERLVASDGQGGIPFGDYFGGWVATSGNTVVIGAPTTDTVDVVDAGSLYVFVDV